MNTTIAIDVISFFYGLTVEPKTYVTCMHIYSAPKLAHIHVYRHDKLTLVTLDLGAMKVTVQR